MCYEQGSLVAQRVKNLPAMPGTQVRSLGQEDPLEKEILVLSARPPAPLCRSWTSTGTSMGGSGSPSCWAWIWPRWRSQPTMSASLNHRRGCSPGEPGRTTPTPRPGAGGGGGSGLTLQHLAILVFSALQAYVHRCEVPDLEVRGHLHRQCEEGPVGGGGAYR